MTRPPATPRDRRSSELAAIHLGRKALGWDDETYRSALEQLTGRTSAAELTAAQRAVVLDRMRELGFRRTGGGAPRPAISRPTQADKVRALWGELGRVGALKDDSDAALQSFVERQTKRSRLEWCTPNELVSVIEGLKGWLRRANSGRTNTATTSAGEEA